MKTYRFLELEGNSQDRAIYDYIEGWEETHEERLPFEEVWEILADNNITDIYDAHGNYIGDN